MRHANGIVAAFKMVDTCAAEFAAETPYYYSVFGSENEAVETSGKKKVLVLFRPDLGSARVSSLISVPVHTAPGPLRKEGYETIIINNNPETVSTDFDIADKLYFEPLTRRMSRASGIWSILTEQLCSLADRQRQADRGSDEDGCADPRNIRRECRPCGGP